MTYGQAPDSGTRNPKSEPYRPPSLTLPNLLDRLSREVTKPDVNTVSWFLAARNGRFPAAFADTCTQHGLASALGVGRAYLETIGAALHAAAVVRGPNDDSTRSKAARILDAEARRLVQQMRRGNNPRADQFFLQLVCTLKNEYERFRGAWVWCDLKYARAFGWVLTEIGQYRCANRPYDLDVISQQVAEALRFEEGISATDVRTAVMLFTRSIPIDDWLTPTATAK
jgi:hypothetical protein